MASRTTRGANRRTPSSAFWLISAVSESSPIVLVNYSLLILIYTESLLGGFYCTEVHMLDQSLPSLPWCSVWVSFTPTIWRRYKLILFSNPIQTRLSCSNALCACLIPCLIHTFFHPHCVSRSLFPPCLPSVCLSLFVLMLFCFVFFLQCRLHLFLLGRHLVHYLCPLQVLCTPAWAYK